MVLLRNGKLATEGLSGTKMDFPEMGNTTVEDPPVVALIYSMRSFDRASDLCAGFFLPSAESPWTFTPLASRKLRQASTFSIWWGDK